MPQSTTSRRHWLRTATLATAALATAPGWTRTPRFTPTPGSYSGFREHLPSLEWEYQLQGRPPLKARLLANENPYGPGPACREAVAASAHEGNRYQHEVAAELKTMIAAYEGVPEDHIMLTPGSSDVLEKMAIVHFKNGGNVVTADPAYMSLIQVTMGMGGTWNKVKLAGDWSHDLPAMRRAINAETKLVYICNPNNPTGTTTDNDELRRFCREVARPDLPVFVDEAYLEFLDDHQQKTMVPLINEGKNVIVARTFSKIHGMAGLRVGYAVATPETLAKVYKITRGNMGLCRTSLEGAKASLADTEFQEQSRQQTAAFREQVYAGLEKLGLTYVPSVTSFVLFPLPQGIVGTEYISGMFDLGVGVRAFDVHGRDYCRVSVGTPEETAVFLDALQKTIA